ncbi:hypothetical protein CXG81DRAFT_27183 [Caulochytrium protostelioides]|uniref:DNA/RNA polymerase n=1 Tax=Caulochytrium protostelioides TaxID=1555241 RepID=A0A4P9X4R0_9FUNG|nr:hypothetical protein CXG81DRAFT_27183 [Caulochytrium protostelioides]|eukprot:RKP00077.1 hypothetical protein CXG81DRAFT_27183 [Caulochytrium protostelioides]
MTKQQKADEMTKGRITEHTEQMTAEPTAEKTNDDAHEGSTLVTTRHQFHMLLKHDNVDELFLMNITAADDSSHTKEIKVHPLDPQLQNQVDRLLHQYRDRFRVELKKRPHSVYDHKIDTGDEPPHFKNPYRLSPAGMLELKKQIDKLLAEGLIRPSKSP